GAGVWVRRPQGACGGRPLARRGKRRVAGVAPPPPPVPVRTLAEARPDWVGVQLLCPPRSLHAARSPPPEAARDQGSFCATPPPGQRWPSSSTHLVTVTHRRGCRCGQQKGADEAHLRPAHRRKAYASSSPRL